MCVINVDVNKLYEVYWSVPNVENKVDDIISILSSVKLPSKSTYQGQLSSVITYMNTVKKQTNEIYQSIGGFLDRYSNAEEANTKLAGKLWSGVTSNINGKDETKEYRDYEASKTLEANKVWSSLSYTVQNPLSKHADPRVEPTSVSIYKALYPEEYNKMLEEEKKSLQKDNKTEAAVTMDKVENGANINSTQTSKKKGHNVLANICNSAISGTEQLFKMNEGVQDFASTVRIDFKDYTFVGTGNKFDEILYSKDEYEAKMREKDLSVIAKNKTGAMYDKLYKNSKRVQSINNEADESFKRGGKWYQTVGQVVNGIGIGIISAFSPSAGGSIVASQSVMGMTGNSIENKTNEEKEKSIHGLQEKYENGEISYKELLNAQIIKNMTSEEWSEYVKKYKEGKITKEEYNSSKKIRELNQTYGSKSDFSKLKKYAASQYAYNAVQMGAGIAVGSSKLSTITKVLADTAGNAIDVPFESFLDKKIYNEEFKEAFKKNGGIAGVVQSALIGAGFSIGGEITSFAKNKYSQSKAQKEKSKETNNKTKSVTENEKVVESEPSLKEKRLSEIDDEISKYKKLSAKSAENMKEAKKVGNSDVWALQNSEFAKYTEKIAELEKQRKSLESVDPDVYERDQTKEELAKKKATEETLSKRKSELEEEVGKLTKSTYESLGKIGFVVEEDTIKRIADINKELKEIEGKIETVSSERKVLETKMKKIEKKSESKVDVKIAEDTNIKTDTVKESSEKTKHNLNETELSKIDDEISKYKKLLEQSAEYMKDAKKAGDSETWDYQNSEYAKYTEKIAELEKQRKSLEEFVPKVDSKVEHVIKRIEIDGESIKNLNSLQNLYISTLRRLKNAGDGDVKIKAEEFEKVREKLNKEIEKIEGKRKEQQVDAETLEGLDNDTKITILRNQLEIKNRAINEECYLTWLWDFVLGDSESVSLDMNKKINMIKLDREFDRRIGRMDSEKQRIEVQIEKLEAGRTIEGDTIEKLIEFQEKKESLKTEIENLQENSKKLMEAIKEKVESGKTVDVEEYLKWESAVSKISEDNLDLKIVEKKMKTLQSELATKVKKIEIDGKSIKNLNSLQNLYVSTLRRLKNAGDGDVKIKAEEFEQVREKLNKEIEKIEGKRKDEQIDVEMLEKLEGLDNDTKIAILRNQLEIKNRALSEQNYSSWLWESVLGDSESVSLDMSKKINTEKLEKEFQRRTDIIDFEREKIEKQIEKLEASKTIEGDPREKLIEFQEKRKNLKKEIEDLQASSKELMDAIREKVESGKEIDVEEYLKWESAVSKISEDNLDLRIVENKIKTLESNLGAKTKVRDKIKAFLSEAIQKGFGEVKLKKVLYRLNKEYPDELEEIIDSWEKLGDSQKNVVLQEMENLDADYEKILDFKEIINTQKNNIEDVNKNNSSVSENNSNDNFIESDKNTQYTEVTGSNFDDTILNEDYNGYKDNTIEDSQNVTKEEVFSLFQDYDKSLYKDSNIEDVITGEYNNDEAFETIFGENYGAKLDIIDEETHENIVSWLIENMNISKEDAEVLINLLDNEDICEYISAVNDIISYFKDKPSLFEYIFGFELYNKTDDGSYVVNDKMLLMDLYFWKNKEILFEENDGKYKIKQDFKDIIENAKNEDEKIDIAKYIKSKNDLITVNTTEDNSLSSATSIEEVKNEAKNIKEKLDTNEEIILNVDRSVEGLNYIDTESDEIYNIEDDKCKKSHVAKLVDISDDGFIISSWGKRLCIKFDEIADNGGISFEINDYEISDENTEEILEELKNNINNKKSQIGD